MIGSDEVGALLVFADVETCGSLVRLTCTMDAQLHTAPLRLQVALGEAVPGRQIAMAIPLETRRSLRKALIFPAAVPFF